MSKETIDAAEILLALDRDLQRQSALAQKLEPILRELTGYYGVPADEWHTFGIIFRLGEPGEMTIASLALRPVSASVESA